ncbi:MAG: arylesterase [Gammaproteobacteria bacterium]|nr:MAG: arylesterase [Gammaproteobacteria bacterium]
MSCSAGRWRLVTEPGPRPLPVCRSVFGRLLLVLLLVAVQTAPAQAQGGVILVLGDSLSSAYGIDVDSGWVQLLQKRLQERQAGYRVVNASISGDTTSGGAARLPRALAKHRPEIVIVELGGNDGLRGLPLSVTRANLERIIVDSQTAGARVLLLGMRLPPNYGPAYTNAFHAIYQELADRYDAARVPFLLEGIGGVDELMQADGIHPRAEAQPLMLDNVWPYLKPLL